MGKVSVGLNGWRFDEEEIFTEDGEWRDVTAMPEDTRTRLVRLQTVIGKPCDACYLIHGEAEKSSCNVAEVVYGEPMDELVLCDDHEADFLFWFRERGGESLAGEETFRDAFHEWFDDGGRAPDGYGGIEHVESNPDDLPDLPDPQEVYDREAELLADERPDFEQEGVRVIEDDETDGEATASGETSVESDAGDDGAADDGEDELSTEDLDLNREYPGSN